MKGIVTSPHALASRRGADVLAAGGTAVEAAITTVLCLAVTMPHFCGLAGDAFLLVCDASGGVKAISGIGQSAADVNGYSSAIPTRGPRSALTSAGTLDALRCAFEISGGRMSWSELVAPALALARDGFETTASERFWREFRRAEAAALPGVFAPRPLGELARTLEALAERGPREFYEGRLAARIVAGLREAGSPLTAADLARTEARVETPLSVPYRGGDLLAHRPPTQGITTLQIMGLLERFDLAGAGEGSADHFHLMVEAVKQAFIDRNRWLADPDFAPLPAELLSAAYLDRRAARIDRGQALPWPQPYQHGDTVYVGAADAAGRSVSMLATIYYDWGSGIVAGDTGLLWHNRGAAFSLDPLHPNCLAPGKRPFHTLNPGMWRKDGRIRLLHGTQGADGQPQTLAALLTRLIDFGMSPEAALAAPRFQLGRTFSDGRDTLKLEEDVGPDLIAELRRRGHEIALLPRLSPLMGQPGVIAIGEDGSFTGAHDPRSEGLAVVV